MRPTFAGMEIARRSLMAQRQALDVTGHNIANANTPGYSRQVARLTTTDPFTYPGFNSPTTAGQMGTGVKVDQVVRMRDAFVQHQINSENHTLGYWSTREDLLRQIELTFLEPSEAGLRNAMDMFWQSLQELSFNPESQAVRAVVRERAIVLADTFRSTYGQLEPLRQQLDTEMRAKAEQINAIAAEITAINKQIASVLAMGQSPNDLYDKREILIEELSRIADLSVVERGQGMVAIAIGGTTLVEGVNQRRLLIDDVDQDGLVDLRWEGTHSEFTVRAGELKALWEGRDEVVPYYLDQLNDLARAIIVEVNQIHNQGYGLHETFDPNDYEPLNPAGGPPPAPPGIDFFDDGQAGVGYDPDYLANAAKTMSLSREILEDAGNIAASRNGAVGDGSNAIEMARLHQKGVLLDGTASASEYLASLVSGLGVQAQKAVRMVEHQDVLVNHLQRMRESVSGVSLDEEMTNLIQYQHAYAAASRLVTTMDEAIDMIVNRMGLVGRA